MAQGRRRTLLDEAVDLSVDDEAVSVQADGDAASRLRSSGATGTDSSADEAASRIRILLASDNHVGYMEKDGVRGKDSFRAFDEIMSLAREHEVDMVLLGGDLFHENKPSRMAMYQVLKSLRANCLGDRPCALQVLSDQSVTTGDTALCHINYEDPDINVSIPVFSINGNHDDPTGDGRISALDVLQIAGLLNYYGRVPENDDICVTPVLLQKGDTKLALYGMSNCRDERLFRSFKQHQVRFMRPTLFQDEWFNLCTVHQNHAAHNATGYLPEGFLPSFMDFVLWGHEHECLIQPKWNPDQEFHVVQPGSSIATSLCEGEAVEKHVAILSVCRKQFEIEPLRLKSVRPFVMKEIVLKDVPQLRTLAERDNKSQVLQYLLDRTEEAIEEANDQWLSRQDTHSRQRDPPLPLIRLRVEYSGGFQVENPQRFSHRFIGRVGNAHDIVQFYLKRRGGTRRTTADPLPNEAAENREGEAQVGIDELVSEALSHQHLQFLPERKLAEAVAQFVEKDERDAVKEFIAKHLEQQIKFLISDGATEADIQEHIEKSVQQEQDRLATEKKSHATTPAGPALKRKVQPDPDFDDSDDDLFAPRQDVRETLDHEGENSSDHSPPSRRTRTSGSSRTSQAPRKASTTHKTPDKSRSTRSRAAAQKTSTTSRPQLSFAPPRSDANTLMNHANDDDDIIEIEDNEDSRPTRTNQRAKSRPSRRLL